MFFEFVLIMKQLMLWCFFFGLVCVIIRCSLEVLLLVIQFLVLLSMQWLFMFIVVVCCIVVLLFVFGLERQKVLIYLLVVSLGRYFVFWVFVLQVLMFQQIRELLIDMMIEQELLILEIFFMASMQDIVFMLLLLYFGDIIIFRKFSLFILWICLVGYFCLELCLIMLGLSFFWVNLCVVF